MDTNQLDWIKGMFLMDRTHEQNVQDISYPFALDELLGRQVGDGASPVCHIWQHPQAFVIGSRDHRLPGSKSAIHWLQNLGYSTLVRHSGGAAVPLDLGVINLSLILPLQGTPNQDLNRDFERMYILLRQTLLNMGAIIDKGEIQGAYCPGDYDLHIHGRKFCGIAQRRQRSAVIIQAFINIEGDGESRAELVRAFYERAGVGAEPNQYPKVETGTMTSLQECGYTGDKGITRFMESLQTVIFGSNDLFSSSSTGDYPQMPDPDAVMKHCDQLKRRYL